VFTYGGLKRELNIDEPTLQEALRPLVFGKGAILTKKRPNLKWDMEDETLTLNLKYTSAAKKVVLIPKERNAHKDYNQKAATIQAADSGLEKERNL
jgi:hypothetical protein